MNVGFLLMEKKSKPIPFIYSKKKRMQLEKLKSELHMCVPGENYYLRNFICMSLPLRQNKMYSSFILKNPKIVRNYLTSDPWSCK